MKKTRHIIKFPFLIIFIVLFSYFNSYSKTNIIVAGEELTYEVSYMGIKLGTVKVVTEGSQKLDGKPVYKVKGYIDSYSGIPFVDLHNISQSWIDPSISYSHKYLADTKDGDDSWFRQLITFDYNKNNIRNLISKGNKTLYEKNYTISQKCNEGLSLFFLARRFSGSKKTLQVPTLMDKDLSPTMFYFSDDRQSTEVDAVKYPVRTVYFSGQADWVGLYGLTGKFEGWFSDDDARVPIKAKMKVYVGNIDVELINWVRPQWAPPRGN